MVHKTLVLARGETIQYLLFTRRAKGDDTQHLRLSACEDGSAMRSWQQSHLAIDGSDGFEITAICASPIVEIIVVHAGFEFFFIEPNDILQAIQVLRSQY